MAKRRRPRSKLIKRREYFIFLGRWFDAIDALPNDSSQLEAYKAIIYYGLTGKELEHITVNTRSILLMAKPDMRASVHKWEEFVALGRLGGNPNFKKGHPNPYQDKINKTKQAKREKQAKKAQQDGTE